ncbi:class I SAM-dependent methyltransferase [Acidocella sp.]|uniref:class I SAM-dependent methyltransferase n=1 Tax=Acidocella sp. TaxID=50710 RepID=UPI00263203E6|nr:class I SAM-dependent methyltransferase [Acidocella sp.]
MRELEQDLAALQAGQGALWPADEMTPERVVERLEGWCTPRKAAWLARLVAETGARKIGEIGVYGGRSLVPMALAARGVEGAELWAVEPWSNAAATACETSAENDSWWQNVDMAKIKAGFLEAVRGCGLSAMVRVVELTADQARAAFMLDQSQGFDVLHIDGAHAEARALADVRGWLPLVRPGGVIVLDDIGWESVFKARDFLRARCEVIEEVREEGEALVTYGAYRVAGGV